MINNQLPDPMEQKIHEFPKKYSEYFLGNIDDETMTDYVSQPFWQSLHLSKRRLDKNNLTMEIDVTPLNNKLSRIDYDNGDKIDSATFKRTVKVNKRIKKGNKIIYRNKDREICISSALKVHGNDEYAVCPRCGNNGKITSYINGCDYCNSKFKVSVFDDKISSFTTEPDGRNKVFSICKKAFITLGILSALVPLVIAVTFAFIFWGSMNDINNIATSNASVIFIVLLDSFKLLAITAVVCAITLLALMFIMLYMYRNERFVRNQLYHDLKMNLPDFSPDDFAQNLEYKLRNIHFADNASAVAPFAAFDLSPVLAKYENVCECFLHKIKFLSIQHTNNGYYMDLSVILRLTRLKGNRVVTENEKLILSLSKKHGVQEQNINGLLEFTCNSCGAGIDIFKGGYCEYCGNKLDYSDYDWIIEKYYSNVNYDINTASDNPVEFGKHKYIEYYKKTRFQMLSLIIGAIILVISVIGFTNKDMFKNLANRDDYIEISKEEFDSLPKLTDVYSGSDLTLQSDSVSLFKETYTYSFSGDFDYLVETYANELDDHYGYSILVTGYDNIALSKAMSYEGSTVAYYIISIKNYDDNVKLKFEIYNNKEDYLED